MSWQLHFKISKTIYFLNWLDRLLTKIPKMPKFCSAVILFCWPFCTCTWSPHHPMAESPHQFLFRYFCSAGAFLHLNPIYHITWQMLPLQSPNIKWTKSVKHPLLYPFNFCSAIFVPQFFVPQFLFCWPFCTCTWGPHHPMAESPHQFLFCNFCSADLFALALGVPVTQWPRVLTNFCSTW